MRLSPSQINDIGTKDERVVFRVLEECNVGDYFTFISHYTNVAEKRVSTNVTAPYWFPDRIVKKGDYVVVYTKEGVSSDKQNADGSSSYFFYRGLSSSCCNIKDVCVVLLSVAEWGSKGV